MPTYYPWNETLTRGNADIVMVIGARGYGKTYGLRKQFIRDALKGFRFVEIVRHKAQLKGDDAIQHGYFEKLEQDPEFKDRILLKTQGVRAFMGMKRKGKRQRDQKRNYILDHCFFRKDSLNEYIR